MALKIGAMKDKQYYESLDKRTLEYKEYKNGLGDKVASVTDALGIKKCKGCSKRQESLNLVGHQLEYFYKKHMPNPFTQDNINEWENFINRENQNLISLPQQLMIVRLLKDILNMSVSPCNSCSGSVWDKYIRMIQTVYQKN